MQSRRTSALWTIRLSSRGRRNTVAALGAAHPPDTRRPGKPHAAASHPPRSEQNTKPHKEEDVLVRALQMKGQWESNINVWFPFMYSQKWKCYFQNRINMFCIPVPTLIYLWGSVCLFCCREICGPILGIYKSFTDTWMWKLGLRPRNSQKRNTPMGFSLQCRTRSILLNHRGR
jgi:hypothetical protein